MNKMKQYNVEVASWTQSQLCKNKNLPMFAPQSGICGKCGENIYSKGGVDIKRAGETIITFCPFCNHTFVD